ncbi:MAG: hypothetical protein JO075_03830 [Acidimicrobiia bacterium]|nr:hypothetical protein [Acidimicrobiia bacterium]
MRRLALVAGAVLGAGGLAVLVSSFAFGAGTSGTEQFTIFAGANGSGSVLASGVFAAGGKDVQVTPNLDRFVFSQGTLLVAHRTTANHDRFSPATCVANLSETGVYQITGTGGLAGATGHGTYVLHGTVIGPHTAAGCSQTATGVGTIVVHASGPFSLGG